VSETLLQSLAVLHVAAINQVRERASACPFKSLTKERQANEGIRNCGVIQLVVLFALLTVTDGAAYAEWRFLTTDGKGNTVYFDPDTVSRQGTFVKVWVLLDATTARETLEGVSFLSSRTLHQYDCVKERFRFLGFTLFSGNMGSGQTVQAEYHVLDWERIPSKGSSRRLLKWACSKDEIANPSSP
jgi:hypothetical protein